MKDTLQYFIQSGFSMIVLYGFYWLLLKKETCFTCNRIFLLFALLFSSLIPFTSGMFSNGVLSGQYYVMLKPVIVGPDIRPNSGTGFNIANFLLWIYLAGVIINIVRIFAQALRLIILAHKTGISREYGANVVFTEKNAANFSFFNIVFLSNSVGNKENIKRIITHEQAHIRQKHFIDLIIIEILTTVFWFNPVIWLYRRSLIAVHEYLADEYVLSQGIEKSHYQELLINQSFGLPVLALANNFNQSLIKRRFIMMSKTKSKFKAVAKLLFVVPVILSIAFIVSCTGSPKDETRPAPPDNASRIQDSNNPDKVIFDVVEQMPQYPGGDDARIKYLAKNLKYPEEARKEGIEGKVFVTFVVEKDGSITGAKILKGIGGGCDEETIRVIENMPNWEPGKQRGKTVRVRFNMPIVFKLNGAYKEAA